LTALSCSRLRCHRPHWTDGPACVHDLSLDFTEGYLHAITGPPRSGKTLLLRLLGLLEEPDFGTIELFDQQVSPAPEDLRIEIRNTIFGFVFSNPCLVPAFTVAENIAMPLFRISGADEKVAHIRVAELLERFGIEEHANVPTFTLDGDIQFLVALARALVQRPRVLFLLAPSRPGLLAPYVRSLVNDLKLTCLWSGQAGDWAACADHELQLDLGLVSGERISA
jgi:ABC-type lipoprotein export system ATPase subunit